MKIVYRFVEDFKSRDVAFLATIGIKVKEGFDLILIDEHSPQLEALKKHFKKSWNDNAKPEMLFEKQELKSAPFLHIYAEKYVGYAEDQDVFTVAATDPDYGILRGEQTGLFKMKGEPKWGKFKIAALHFAEDIFFTDPATYESIFKPLNIASKPVLDQKTNTPLKTVVQLVQQGISGSRLIITDPYIDELEKVDSWQLTKYIRRADRPFPLFEKSPGQDHFFYTQEYFGSGAHTQRGTIITTRLYQLLSDNKITGLNYEPLIPMNAALL